MVLKILAQFRPVALRQLTTRSLKRELTVDDKFSRKAGSNGIHGARCSRSAQAHEELCRQSDRFDRWGYYPCLLIIMKCMNSSLCSGN